jgi:endoglucanase
MFKAFLVSIFFLASCSDHSQIQIIPKKTKFGFAENVVETHGRLSIKGSQLVDQHGEAIQLKGMSSHGLQWYQGYAYANYNTMKKLRDEWNQTVFRAAMYTAEGSYLQNPDVMKQRVQDIVKAAIELNTYVIIDWHILSDRNPMWNKDKAKVFFAEMAKAYASYPNVMYELANEPNGGDVNWYNAIKPYALEVIPEIRKYDPLGVIIVGTGTWSQDVQAPAQDPIKMSNIMYACHFYAATHGSWLRDRVSNAMNSGIAIFVTEWGTMGSSGDGGINYGETEAWANFMRDKKISWANWSLSNSGQTHSILKSGANTQGGWGENDITESGKLVRKYMKQ